MCTLFTTAILASFDFYEFFLLCVLLHLRHTASIIIRMVYVYSLPHDKIVSNGGTCTLAGRVEHVQFHKKFK